MAETSPPAVVEPVSKPVQGLLSGADETPEICLYKGEEGAIDASFPQMEVPIIDLNLLTSSSPVGEDELGKLRSALGSCGCFQAINHEMEISFLEKIRGVAKQFFALPIEEKQKYSRTAGAIDGYGSSSLAVYWADVLYLTVSPEDQSKIRFWPQNPQDFRKILEEFTAKLSTVHSELLKSMARSLNLEEHCFLNQYGVRGRMNAKFNLYPPCPRPDPVFGIKPHADGSTITFLLQDKEVEGLQMLKDGKWYRVPIVPHALLVFIGDQAEIMSNGMFKSPVHRVMTNSERERITVAVFCFPESDKEIGPIEELIADGRMPRLYRNVSNFFEIYLKNSLSDKRPIDIVKI
ncbi:hypothetical protein U1Q18_028253 [Sarracenia purpurea var. burkii]